MMEGADLNGILGNVGGAALAGIKLVGAVGGVAGLVIFSRGMLDIIERALSPGRRETGPLAIVAKFLVGAALTAMSVLMWQSGGTFVLSTEPSHSLFSYLPPKDQTLGGACQSINSVAVLVFGLLGVTAFYKGLMTMYQAASGQRRQWVAEAATFLIGGTVAFLITDASLVVGNTLRMRIGLDQLCTALGAG